ncbi:response regulator [Acidisoma cladoniae]|uniref:response regulator n=1 Tax=Acidisoma cladoniae TaxID=3040935 RepID=UPI00254F5FD5|nr:response regulator [Acidisoma sp. PAMC 29798]
MTSLRIVLVEDDDLIGILLGAMLEGMGHDVVAVVATEDDAVAAAAHHQPDLMIVDVQLREGSGPAAIARVLETGQVPHLFMSGAALRTEATGVVVLRKPFLEKGLLQAMRRALEVPA